ncbi:MAG: hypothetical protein AB7V58_04590 [Solirubrobacterales bacterium]
MTKLLATLLVALAGLAAAPGQQRAPELHATAPPTAPPLAAAGPVPRILCQRPPTLRLRRFEDRSAQVICSGRVLARIAVPG